MVTYHALWLPWTWQINRLFKVWSRSWLCLHMRTTLALNRSSGLCVSFHTHLSVSLASLRRVFNMPLTATHRSFPFSTQAWFLSSFFLLTNRIGWRLVYSYFLRREKAKLRPSRINPWLYGLFFLWKSLDYKAVRHVLNQSMTFLGVVYIIFDDWGLHVVLINSRQITD